MELDAITDRQVWTIEGRQLTMPVRIRDAAVAGALYTCPVASAERVLAGTPFTPLRVGRRAFATLVTIAYLDGDLGVYDEVGVQVMVRGPQGIGVYTLDLPVTATFTRAAGRTVWGLPKFLVQGSIVREARQTRVEITDGDDFILSGSIPTGVPVPGRYALSLTGWSLGLEGADRGSVLRMVSRVRARAARFRFGGRPIALGSHPMAQTARELGLGGRPLMSFGARVAVDLDAATPVPA